MTTGFEGRVVVVTGGASGVGRACVELLMAEGALVASIDLALTAPDLVRPTFELVGDVRDQASMDSAMADIARELGRIDVLVNNAGVSFVGGVEDGDEDEWRRVFDVNLLGYVRATRAALPHLRRSEAPSIVNVSSTTATSGFRRRSLYSATKGAIEAMTRSMAADLVAEGITVNAVNPGTVDTPFMTELAARTEDPAATRAAFDARQPTGRMVHPREVGRAVAYCAHPDNRSLVGSTIVVDGGILGLHITEA
jgi:NAD(P)-dependent dehydrogenase (short-subunit alcohol dehydrogenase family)